MTNLEFYYSHTYINVSNNKRNKIKRFFTFYFFEIYREWQCCLLESDLYNIILCIYKFYNLELIFIKKIILFITIQVIYYSFLYFSQKKLNRTKIKIFLLFLIICKSNQSSLQKVASRIILTNLYVEKTWRGSYIFSSTARNSNCICTDYYFVLVPGTCTNRTSVQRTTKFKKQSHATLVLVPVRCTGTVLLHYTLYVVRHRIIFQKLFLLFSVVYNPLLSDFLDEPLFVID